MANVIQFDDLKDQNNQNQQPTPPGTQPQQNASGQGNQYSQNQPGGYQQNGGDQYKPDAYNKQKQGSGYTNIGRVIQANQGNRLGQAVAGGVQQAGQQAQANVQQAGQQFGQQTQANRFDTDANQQLVQNVLADPSQYAGPTDQNSDLSNQGSMFSKLISGQYGGPTQLANDPQLQAQVGGVQQLGKALGSSGGQIGLLQQAVGGNNYGAGKQNLDQLLLAKTSGDALGQARRQALGLGNILNTQEAGAQAVGQEMGARAQDFGKNVQNQFGQTVTTQDKALQDQATKAQTDRDEFYKKTLADLQSGKITQKQADLLGLGAGSQVTGDILGRLGSYVSENADKATAQNVASSQDYARMDALRKLSGQYSPADAQALLQNYSGQNAQAGKFAAEDAVQADKTGFQTALGSQMQDYHNKLDPVQEGFKQAQDINNLVRQRDAAGGMMSPAGMAIQQQINQKYPGASYGGWTRSDWANSLLQTAQKKFQDTQATLNAAYGGLQGIEILPEQQAQQDQAAVGPTLAGALNDNPNAFKVS